MKTWKRYFLFLLLACLLSGLTVFSIACDDDDDDDNDDDAGDDDDDDDDDDAVPVTVSGNAFGFPDYEYIVGAEISIVEMPELTTTVDENGYFEFADLMSGDEVTFLLSHDDYYPTQTKTFTLPKEDVEKVTFQVPSLVTFQFLAAKLGLKPDPTMCQMVTTVTRVGKSIYDEGAHGEAGATVSSEPEIPEESGPTYFNEEVQPDPSWDETSDDGGVVWTNVPAGKYVLSAHKDGVEFIEPTMYCRAGVLVNASPPYGLQAVE